MLAAAFGVDRLVSAAPATVAAGTGICGLAGGRVCPTGQWLSTLTRACGAGSGGFISAGNNPGRHHGSGDRRAIHDLGKPRIRSWPG